MYNLGGFQPKEPEQKVVGPLERESSGRKAGKRGVDRSGPVVRVTLVNFRRRLLDGDNLAGGFKPLRDAIARWLGLDDSDKIIEWEYGQQLTQGQQGTAVRIERISQQ